jgi:hypothetical protein
LVKKNAVKIISCLSKYKLVFYGCLKCKSKILFILFSLLFLILKEGENKKRRSYSLDYFSEKFANFANL